LFLCLSDFNLFVIGLLTSSFHPLPVTTVNSQVATADAIVSVKLAANGVSIKLQQVRRGTGDEASHTWVILLHLPHTTHRNTHNATQFTTPPTTSPQPHQGYRTAQNAGLPFVVIGRKLSADALRRSLAPLVEMKRAGRKLSKSDGNFDPADRTLGLSARGEAKGADIAEGWRRGAETGWAAARVGGAVEGAVAAGSVEEE
jgi:hypothetical protein